MTRGFSNRFTGCAFLAAALMLWGGWMSLPVHVGPFFEGSEFDGIQKHLQFWLWMYRVHLFGMIVAVVALVALGSLLTQSEARVVVWPGVAVASSGLVVGALGAAFYYHHGVWGALNLAGGPGEAVRRFLERIQFDTEYVTCLVRFGRVFSGLGLVLVGSGIAKWRFLPSPLGWSAVVLGIAAMALTMGLPDRLEFYEPVFHLLAVWLAVTGGLIFTQGLRPEAPSAM